MKYNKKAVKKVTVNFDGHKAYKKTDKLELVGILLSSFMTGKDHYNDDPEARLVNAVRGVDPTFAMKAALYARDVFGMRSTSHVVAGELAGLKNVPGSQKFFEKIVVRPDDMLEIISYFTGKYTSTRKNGKVKLPNALKKGFKKAFDKFDEYSLAKYRGENKGIKLVDVMNLCNPVPTDRNAEALEKLAKNKLRSFDTWEKEVSENGPEAWKSLVEEGKLKPFALLRNLRNISQHAPEVLPKALEQLVDSKKSRILPFRFYTAYKEMSANKRVVAALDKAVNYADVPEFLEDTLIAVDISYSMVTPLAGSDKVHCKEVAAFLAAILAKRGYADVMTFTDRAKMVSFNPADSVFSITEKIANSNESRYTNFECVLEAAKKKYSRIIMLSDMQVNSGSVGAEALKKYKKKFDADPFIYVWDLRGYSTTQFPENGQKVIPLAGFSEKIFELMGYCETDTKALIHAIEAIEL